MQVLYGFNILGFQEPGGGEIQATKSREYLVRRGVQVDLFDPFRPLRGYDLLHIFGLTHHTYELAAYWKRMCEKPLIVSPLWWSFDEYYRSTGKLPAYLRNRLFRQMRGVRLWADFQRWSDVVFDIRGQQMRICDLVITVAEGESRQVIKEFAVSGNKVRVVPNGVDPSFYGAAPDEFVDKYGIADFILCVGAIHPKKNQLFLLRSLRGTSIPIVFIGACADREYFSRCQSEADSRGHVHFLGYIPHSHSLLASAYAAAEVVALPSWFDAPGLVTLEAALAGTKVVVTNRGPTREYFGDLVVYVDPSSLDSIRKGVLEAYERKDNGGLLRDHVKEHFTWDKVAARLETIYKTIL